MEVAMCRNIRPLFNYDPVVTEEEIRASALQYVRKVSGYTKPSQANEAAFNDAIERVSGVTRDLIESLVTNAPARNREVEAEEARERARVRYRWA
jgi:hypothetical protein